MATIADRIVEIAKGEVGVREVPWGSNRGPRVEEYQASTVLKNPATGWPWCAAFVEWVWEEAGLTPHPANPSTYIMCVVAATRNEISDTPQIGGAIIWCGTHTGIVVGIGSGVVYTVEGNSGDQVATRTRAIAGARFINPANLGTVTEPPRVYWIDDPGAVFKVYGPWAKEAYAQNAYDQLEDKWQRRADILRTGDGRYVLRVGDKPRMGPFYDKAKRDEVLDRLAISLGRDLVPRSNPIKGGDSAPNPSGPADELGKTT